jgi:hypothetical protein
MITQTCEKMTGWNVFLWNNETRQNENLDTVFFESDMDKFDVKNSLVNHDGFSPDITVEKEN